MTAFVARPLVRVGVALMVVLLAAISLPTGMARAAVKTVTSHVPVIFVHGNSGSAQQFETDAMRFSSNGWPDKDLYAYEYDTSGRSNDAAVAGLDGFIASVEVATGSSQVDVLAHSRGTSVMFTYLNSSTQRAANVRKYVNFDGATGTALPGGVPTLAIWAEGNPARTIVGATNVSFPTMSHNEVTTSAAAFAAVYRFLNGTDPATTDVVPQPPGQVTVSGRASYFPANAGAAGATLRVYRVFAATGQRKDIIPDYKVSIGPDGSFGPLRINGQAHYEFAVTLPTGVTQHVYFQPFERSDHFVRLLVSPPGGIDTFITRDPTRMAITVLRMREWRADQPTPSENDQLLINGSNVLNPVNDPRRRDVISVFVFDAGDDGVTDLNNTVFPFSVTTFLTNVDMYIPARADHSGTVSLTNIGRQTGAITAPQQATINVPDWPSSTDGVTVQFKEYVPLSFSSGHGS